MSRWQNDAACNDANRPDDLTADAWYPEGLATLSGANLRAILTCRTACPVIDQCAAMVGSQLAHHRWGIWAGLVHDRDLLPKRSKRRLDGRAHVVGLPEGDHLQVAS